MTLTGFPLDSTQIGYHEDGLPAYSSEYSSKNYRDVLAALISDGVIARVGNALKIEFADEQQHMNATASLTMTSGAAVKGGCMCITKGETVSVTAPQITGDETVATKRTAIGIAFYGDGLSDSTAEESVEIDVRSSSSQPSYASNALYMAEVISKTVKHSGGTYSYSHEIQDLRASEHCGFSAPFVDIDLSSFYDNVNDAINDYSMEIANNIALLQGWTQTAVELAQDALDDTVAGNIYIRLDELEADGSVTSEKLENGSVSEEKLSQSLIDKIFSENTIPMQSVFEAADGFTLYTGGGNVVKYGNQLFFNVAFTRDVSTNENQVLTLGYVKSQYAPAVAAVIGNTGSIGYIEKDNGYIAIRSLEAVGKGVRIWIRGSILLYA